LWRRLGNDSCGAAVVLVIRKGAVIVSRHGAATTITGLRSVIEIVIPPAHVKIGMAVMAKGVERMHPSGEMIVPLFE
jgi:hypothetical protein